MDESRPLTEHEVHELHQRARQHRMTFVDQALSHLRIETSPSLRQAAFAYVERREMVLRPVSQHGLITVAGQGERSLRCFTRSLRPAFKVGRAFERARRNAQGPEFQKFLASPRIQGLFNGQSRIYFEMPDASNSPPSDTEQKIAEYLSHHYYNITDYVAGKARDKHGRERKIGKILLSHQKYDLYEAFCQDPRRAYSRKHNTPEQLLVISIHPYDLLRMSLGRNWDSCAKWRANYLDDIFKESKAIAYLINAKDPNIWDPLARSTLYIPEREKSLQNVCYVNTAADQNIRVGDFESALQTLLRRINKAPQVEPA